jgi:uncharacterized membrane protein
MHNVIPGLIVALTLIFTAIAYPQLPETITTQWNLDGTPDGFSSRALGAWLIPGVMFLIWLIMRFLPKIDPRAENYQRFMGTYRTLISVVIGFMALMHIAVLGSALGWPIQIPKLMPFAVGAMLVFMGNLLPRARPNWFVGIRTPWTLSSDRIWERTHRLGGILFVVSGLVLIAATFGPTWMVGAAIGVAITLGGVTPLLYSLVLWIRERRVGDEREDGQLRP